MNLHSFLHNTRRSIGSYLASDVIEEIGEEYNKRMKKNEKEMIEKTEQYKHRIDEYVDHFMRCKIERNGTRGFNTRMQVMVEYDAEAFGFMNDGWEDGASMKREFMAQEIAHRVHKEVYSARLVVPYRSNHL